MSRLERNLRRKRRRRRVFFSLVLVAILFVLAIVVTNNTMVQATGLPPDKNLFSAQRAQAYVTDKIDYVADKVQDIDISLLRQQAKQLIGRSISFIKSLKERWNSL